MTVGYMREAATAKVWTFLKLLFRWRGSVWKSTWRELLVWMFMYFTISAIYRFFLRGTPHGQNFELLVSHCNESLKQFSTMLTFAMGFYVSQIFSRWWDVFMMIPWPDAAAFYICSFVRPRSKSKQWEDLTVRKTMIRYLILSYVLIFRDISERIKKRFPTYNHLVPSLLTSTELRLMEKSIELRHQWIPIEWCLQTLKKCYQKEQIDETHYGLICKCIIDFRERLHNLLSYDWVNVPLVYTQVVNVCILSYFFVRAIGSQHVNPDAKTQTSANANRPLIAMIDDSVLPVFAVFEFIFFVGWLKVAQVMINPFGMDDDDFEIDVMIERNLEVGYAYIDNLYEKLPPLVNIKVDTLPHTMASAAMLSKANPMVGSAANVEVTKAEQQILSEEHMRALRLANTRVRPRPRYHSTPIISMAEHHQKDETAPLLPPPSNAVPHAPPAAPPPPLPPPPPPTAPVPPVKEKDKTPRRATEQLHSDKNRSRNKEDQSVRQIGTPRQSREPSKGKKDEKDNRDDVGQKMAEALEMIMLLHDVEQKRAKLGRNREYQNPPSSLQEALTQSPASGQQQQPTPKIQARIKKSDSSLAGTQSLSRSRKERSPPAPRDSLMTTAPPSLNKEKVEPPIPGSTPKATPKHSAEIP